MKRRAILDDGGMERHPVSIPLTPTADRANSEETIVSSVRERLEANAYKVDAESVAEEIIRKLRLMRWARRELTSEAGRIPGRPAKSP